MSSETSEEETPAPHGAAIHPTHLLPLVSTLHWTSPTARHPPDHKQKALDDVIGTAFASDRLQVLGPRCGVGIRLLLGVFCLPCSFFNNCVTPFLFLLSILLPLQPG